MRSPNATDASPIGMTKTMPLFFAHLDSEPAKKKQRMFELIMNYHIII